MNHTVITLCSKDESSGISIMGNGSKIYWTEGDAPITLVGQNGMITGHSVDTAPDWLVNCANSGHRRMMTEAEEIEYTTMRATLTRKPAKVSTKETGPYHFIYETYDGESPWLSLDHKTPMAATKAAEDFHKEVNQGVSRLPKLTWTQNGIFKVGTADLTDGTIVVVYIFKADRDGNPA